MTSLNDVQSSGMGSVIMLINGTIYPKRNSALATNEEVVTNKIFRSHTLSALLSITVFSVLAIWVLLSKESTSAIKRINALTMDARKGLRDSGSKARHCQIYVLINERLHQGI